MKPLFLDFETFWADDFSLRHITPIEYINSPRFEALGCAFIDGDSEVWVDGPDLEEYFRTIDWANTFAVSHNALFDMLILARRYNVFPAVYGCTLSMSRNWLAYSLKSQSLKSVAAFYGLGEKKDVVSKTKGVNFLQLRQTRDLYDEVRQYAIDDAKMCRDIFYKIMEDDFPPAELETIDMVTRMATQPKFELDAVVLAEHLAAVKARKEALLAAAGLDQANVWSIMSDTQLAAKLLFMGVNPIPTKVSKKTGKQSYAFAKTDKEFLKLLNHDEPLVQALVAARLGVKSTLEETRTERLLSISRVIDGMPVPLRYSGAHTHRFSGDWNINLQNLPRGGELRRAFRAPKGQVVVAVDASQIEARINATISGEDDLVDAFREGRDVYCEFAKIIYGYDIDKKVHHTERFVGKTGILSLGYGSSAEVFQNMCRVQGNVLLEDGEATAIVQLYRARYKRIVDNWEYAHKNILPQLISSNDKSDEMALDYLRREMLGKDVGEGDATKWGPVRVMARTLLLPNANRLRYRELKHELFEKTWRYVFKRGEQTQKIYGAKLVENIVQALAFIHIMDVAKRVKHNSNGLLLPQHQVHDELIYVVPEGVAEQVRDYVVAEMSRPPRWLPEAPLAAEGHIGETYFDAK